mmetsp:Transcript_6260/g.10867  ORF Transcript_6260/g.10867 Transcript_6260/m.10867 type:complete len:1006 (+) Transcript_6260:325-3342(+)|eukprot:CAMPEP_0201870766 /NCGR_PEP_ID=MMETSP0902-20130614/3831_1 /ASSEMBLY_ACC=CAM_ASM_000551 /TAXON_ID=420261 /ORGANISM="Thalassiosira antarctica, Strain CCMP982" /LENGTH=1005 /DNA_ID=CAMNT_0048396535 /DNA_START=277 /DNA_END=3294 /DNA_ORIENTATION=-
MKRALAKRVSQERGDPKVPPNGPPSSLPMGYTGMNGAGGGATGHPPSKIPRTNMAMSSSSSSSLPMPPMSDSSRDLPQSVLGRMEINPMPAASSGMAGSQSSKKRPRSPPNASTSGNTTAYRSQKSCDENNATTATPKGRGPGRPRKSAVKQPDSSDEDEADNSSFYLKQQNAGLTSELYSYRRRIYLLEREREFRRKECRVAGYKIGELGGVWKGLESAIGKELERNKLLKKAKPRNGGGSSTVPACTGSGTDVETVHSLLHSIQSLVSNTEKIKSKEPLPQDSQHHVDEMNNFESYSKGTIKTEEDEDIMDEKRRLKDMEEFATDIASRAAILRDGVFGLLRTVTARGGSDVSFDSLSVPSLKEQIARLESELKSTEYKLEEMANTRNEVAASERRVRRGLHRLSIGRLTVEEVLKAVEKEDNGVSFNETLAMIDGMNNKKIMSSPDATTSAVVSSSDGAMSSPAFSAAVTGGSKDSPALNGEDVIHLKKSLQDAEVISETRDKKITELLSEREHQMKRINSLLLPKDGGIESPGDESIRKSPLFVDAMAKLGTSERKVKELESAHGKIMEKWSAVKGHLELAKKTLADMEEKHGRRWTELISQFSESDSTAALKEESSGSNNDMFSNAKKTAELESKLQQTMEAVGRMETLRATLADAYKMNEQLQSKLEDLRTKNAKMVAEKVAAREKSKEAESAADSLTSPHGSSRRTSAGASSNGDPAIEKLQRDYRRARKEVSAAVLSKDQAKLKQERAEKERDALMKTNARLLKHSSDKDDMNAKSLSTILHLKQRNEELEKENAIIKQKAQAAQQLSLAARLASNAKDRVGEEALKEKELLDETIKQLRKESQSLRSEKEHIEGLLAQSKEKAASITKDLDAARTRCDDLVSESNKKEKEKKVMMEELAVAKKEAKESAMKAASATGNSDTSSSAFTMEQMTTQVKYLSGRINCPVCNVREKNCILLRCRHMFCQSCVDVNIKNRSRKCPACAQRFDTKDVAEIWL